MLEHHDFSESVETNFYKGVKILLSNPEDVSNFSEDDSNDLFNLETNTVSRKTELVWV